MTITAICGSIGSGKSLKQLEYALEQCQSKRKRLVTNFSLNLKALGQYAGMKKYGWISHLIDTGQIACVDALNSIQDLLIYPSSVVCLDEAGIFLNSREFAKTPKSLLMDLAQSRKFGCDLIYASQFDEQVDKQMRMLTQYFIHADGLSVFSKELRAPRLVSRCYFYFTASDYFEWTGNNRMRCSFFRTYFKAFKTEMGIVDNSHKKLFECFDSFARLDAQVSKGSRMAEKDDLHYSLSKNLHHTRKAAFRRETKKILGYPVDWPTRFPRSILPYELCEIDGHTALLVRYCSASATKAGYSMAEPMS